MPREASDQFDDAEAAATLRAKAHRARLLATGMLSEQASRTASMPMSLRLRPPHYSHLK
jgi:hypothetical protein